MKMAELKPTLEFAGNETAPPEAGDSVMYLNLAATSFK
jgi:hypothetical protein